jgi:hypothetical protein
MSVWRAISVINLEHRRDGRVVMHKQLSRIGWHADFLPSRTNIGIPQWFDRIKAVTPPSCGSPED